MRIAVLDEDKCHPKKCSEECMRYCPRVRSGDETIVMDEETGKPLISVELCVGCGICVHKCPFHAIHIENLPEELKEELVHQFGENGFHLFRLPLPKKGCIIGILGQNGIGKTTTLQILAGKIIPNLGHWESPPSLEEILDRWRRTEMYGYLHAVFHGEMKIAFKPQYVDSLAGEKGKVGDIVENDDIAEQLELKQILKKEIKHISGGELQRVAIAATLQKDADIYFLDEPSSYLDISHRLQMARVVRSMADEKMIVVVEHDLAVLDFLADIIHLIYGKKGVYGIVTHPKSVRHGINVYLSGYLKEENIRFGEEIVFEVHPPREMKELKTLVLFNSLKKNFDNFSVEIKGGEIHEGEVIGVVGPNAIGKTTFVKMLAGVIEPTEGSIDSLVRVSYKPQYIKPVAGTVKEIFGKTNLNPLYEKEIVKPLGIEELYEREIKELSGGELQTVAIALCLSREADVYLLDEPSAYLDATQRMKVAKIIKRVMEKEGVAALVVDHDVYFIDMVSQSLMVFTGKPGIEGKGMGPFDLRTGMNIFLKELGITFRRDEESNRPRVNKPGSRLDREQKAMDEYYYEPLA
ncbi:MAG: ribosome biogenesis/translation initiation ATPase RLI [Thermoplasmata archaeon]|nr:MAG: ribosome biogenesis/translation initiation ATPase RLI [Thermoplasmata archaeon]